MQTSGTFCQSHWKLKKNDVPISPHQHFFFTLLDTLQVVYCLTRLAYFQVKYMQSSSFRWSVHLLLFPYYSYLPFFAYYFLRCGSPYTTYAFLYYTHSYTTFSYIFSWFVGLIFAFVSVSFEILGLHRKFKMFASLFFFLVYNSLFAFA